MTAESFRWSQSRLWGRGIRSVSTVYLMSMGACVWVLVLILVLPHANLRRLTATSLTHVHSPPFLSPPICRAIRAVMLHSPCDPVVSQLMASLRLSQLVPYTHSITPIVHRQPHIIYFPQRQDRIILSSAHILACGLPSAMMYVRSRLYGTFNWHFARIKSPTNQSLLQGQPHALQSEPVSKPSQYPQPPFHKS